MTTKPKRIAALGSKAQAADVTISKSHYILIEIVRIIQSVTFDVLILAVLLLTVWGAPW